jgi:hypothetical protein
MTRTVKIISLLLALVSFPLVLMMAGFAPALMGGGGQGLTALQKIAGNGIMLALLALPIWVLFFAWRTIRTWGSSSVFAALMTALPAGLVIALFVVINFGPLAS